MPNQSGRERRTLAADDFQLGGGFAVVRPAAETQVTHFRDRREGFTPKDDRLPKRLHEAFTSGPLKDVRVEPEAFQHALRLYHQMEGWDPETGWPTFAKLAELGIEWAAKPGDTW